MRDQFAGVGDLALSDPPDLRCLQGDDGGRLAGKRSELRFVGPPVAVNVNHRADISGFQSRVGDGTVENDAFVFLNMACFFFLMRIRQFPNRPTSPYCNPTDFYRCFQLPLRLSRSLSMLLYTEVKC